MATVTTLGPDNPMPCKHLPINIIVKLLANIETIQPIPNMVKPIYTEGFLPILSDVMKQRAREQKVAIQVAVLRGNLFTQFDQ